jgi:hypothetical protein
VSRCEGLILVVQAIAVVGLQSHGERYGQQSYEGRWITGSEAESPPQPLDLLGPGEGLQRDPCTSSRNLATQLFILLQCETWQPCSSSSSSVKPGNPALYSPPVRNLATLLFILLEYEIWQPCSLTSFSMKPGNPALYPPSV